MVRVGRKIALFIILMILMVITVFIAMVQNNIDKKTYYGAEFVYEQQQKILHFT